MAKRDVFWNHENADHRRLFSTALAPLVVVLWKRSEPFGGLDTRIYMRTLKHVPHAILAAAVEQSLETDKWFPEPAKLLSYAADILTKLRREAQAKWLTDCEDCHGSRWQDIEVDGVQRVTRCDCWKRMQVALAEIGQPIDRPKMLTEAR